MNPFLASARDTVRTQLWPIPVAGIITAVVAAVLLPRLDALVDDRLPSWLSAILFGGDAGAARTLLDAISSSLITVTSLTFSLTVVTLQLASSQFSPRLLRTFTSDVFVQTTLAIFLATFTYALTLLRAIRGTESGAASVPKMSITLAFVMGLVSVLCLVLFLAHLARQIRVETMLRDVHDAASATMRNTTRSLDDAQPQPAIPTPPHDALPLSLPSSGFVTGINESELLSAAVEFEACLIIDRHPGSNVIEGVPIGVAWSPSGHIDSGGRDRLTGAIGRAIGVGYERTAAQDIGYGLRQLTDVVNKALSSGINDPTTATHALGHVSAVLCELAGRDLRSRVLSDDEGHVRVVLRRPTYSDMVDAAISAPRRFGSSDPEVLERLFRVLEEISWHLSDHRVVLEQLERLQTTVSNSEFDHAEISRLEQSAVRVRHAVASNSGGKST